MSACLACAELAYKQAAQPVYVAPGAEPFTVLMSECDHEMEDLARALARTRNPLLWQDEFLKLLLHYHELSHLTGQAGRGRRPDALGHNHTQNAHSHVQNVNTGTTGAQNGYGVDTSTSGSGATGLSTANTTATNIANTTGITATTSNPSGGVATGTTAAGSAHSHGAGTLAASAPTFTGSPTSVLQPYLVVYIWKRTA